MPITVQVVAPAQPRWREMQRILRRHRTVRVVGDLSLSSVALERAAALAPDVLLVAADVPETPVVPQVRALRAASPRSRIVLLGTATQLESTTLVTLASMSVVGMCCERSSSPACCRASWR